jgi:hypothetical protein
LRLSLLNECCQDYDCPILGRVCWKEKNVNFELSLQNSF